MPDKEKTVKLTGLPVSPEMKDILCRLSNKQDVTMEEIDKTVEMRMARSNIAHETPTIDRKNREDIQEYIKRKMLEAGSASVDAYGDTVYNGSIETGRRLDIVIGLPASGKSSAIADTLSAEFKSRIIDNDEAKKMIPQYNSGWGADVVHEESQLISDSVFKESADRHENIVLPKVGSSSEKLINKYISYAKKQGYTVNIHYVELDRNKALGRMLSRFIEDGRFLQPQLIDKYAPIGEKNKIEQSYEYLKGSEFITGYSKWNNDVARGDRPVLLEYNNLNGRYIEDAVKAKGVTGNDTYLRDSGKDGQSVCSIHGVPDSTPGITSAAFITGKSQTVGKVPQGGRTGEAAYNVSRGAFGAGDRIETSKRTVAAPERKRRSRR